MGNLSFEQDAQPIHYPVASRVLTSVEEHTTPGRVTPVTDPASDSGTTGQVPMTDAPAAIRLRNACRRALKITQLGTSDVWIGFGPSTTPGSGDLLVGIRGAFVVIPSTLDVWGVCDAGNTSTLSYLEVSQ